MHAQVIWVDLLTKEEFEAGFGSHTPIFSGMLCHSAGFV